MEKRIFTDKKNISILAVSSVLILLSFSDNSDHLTRYSIIFLSCLSVFILIKSQWRPRCFHWQSLVIFAVFVFLCFAAMIVKASEFSLKNIIKAIVPSGVFALLSEALQVYESVRITSIECSHKSLTFLEKLVFLLVVSFILLQAYSYYYPFGVTYDVEHQLSQVTGKIRYNTIHSIGHTMLLSGIYSVFHSFTPVILLQIFAIICLYLFSANYFAKKGSYFPAILLLFGLAAIIISPREMSPVFYPWKDAPAAVCLGVVTVILIKIQNDGITKTSIFSACIFGTALAWSYLFRLNGIVAFLVIGIYIIVEFWKHKMKKHLLSVLLAAAVSIGFVNIYSSYVLKPIDIPNGFSIQVFGSGIRQMVKSGELSEEELNEIDEILPLDWILKCNESNNRTDLIWAYDDSALVHSSADTDVLNNEFVLKLGENKFEVIKLYFKLMPRHIRPCIEDIIQNTRAVWELNSTFIRNHMAIVLLYAVIIFNRKIPFSKLSPLLPCLCNTVSIMISTITNEWRYLFPSFMLMPCILLYLFSFNPKKDGINLSR